MCIDNTRETVTIDELIEMGAGSTDIQVLEENGILFLYFPFIEQNYMNRSIINIVCLDDINTDTSLVDLNGSHVDLLSIQNNFTVMYKTKPHLWDNALDNDANFSTLEKCKIILSVQSNATLGHGGWLPWRRCHCTRGHIDENGNWYSSGTCKLYHQVPDQERCVPVCDRSGFIDQNCSNAPCAGC